MGSLTSSRPVLVSTALPTIAGLAISSALNLVALLLWVRLLSPAAFGTLSLVSGSALLLNALAFEWLRLAGARSLIDGAAPDGLSLFALSAWLRLAAALAVGLALLTAVVTALSLAPPGLTPAWNGAILLLAVSEMPFAALTLVARLRLASSRYAFAMIARSALALAAGALLLSIGGGALAIILATAAAQLVVTGLVVARDPLWRDAIATRPSPVDRSELLRLGLPLVVGSALALAAATVDRYLVAGALGIAAAGRYAAPAELVAKTLGFALMAINLGAYPLLVRCWERNGPAAASDALRRNFVVLLAIALPIVAALALWPEAFARALLGPVSLPDAAALLPWLALAALFRLVAVFHFGVALQLARRMTLLAVPPLVTLALLLPFAPTVLVAQGLPGFVRLLAAAQAMGLLSAWSLARFALRTARARSVRP